MGGWLRYFELTAKARTGLSSGLGVWAVIAVLAAFTTWLFINITVFVWLARRYDSLTSALALTGCYLLLTIVAASVIAIVRRRNIARAQLALAARQSNPLLDPRLLTVGLQIGRTLGWRRLASLALVGILAAGIAREWVRKDEPDADEQ